MARKKRRKWLLLVVVVVVLVAVVRSRMSGPTVEPGSYLSVDIEGVYAEGPPKSLVSRLIEERKVLVDLLDNLTKAAHDPRIAGVVVRIGPIAGGWGQVHEIRNTLEYVKQSEKEVVAFLRGEIVGGNKEYYLASVADSVYMPPSAAPMLNGLSAHYYFLGDLWEKFHVAMEVHQIREYKTFGDMLVRRGMTPAHREMANSILDDINSQFVETIADARGVSEKEMAAIIDSCPSSSSDFVEAGLSDGVLFLDELAAKLGKTEPAHFVEESDYADVSAASVGIGGGPKVAVIHAVGTIVPGKGGRRGLFGRTAGSRALTKAFRTAAADSDIRAIVFRVDSPGGSATASDAVWRSARLARQKKPVVASFGDVAASGGYYMGSAADHIVAGPTTLTGSIGVVLFKPNVAGLLGRVGIGSEGLGRGRYARIMDVTKGLDRAEFALLQAQMDGVYKRFLDRVAEGRGMTVEEIDRLGGGRVWTGSQALESGLIDELGGLREAIRAAAVEAGIRDVDDVEIVYLPAAKGLLEQLSSINTSDAETFLPTALIGALETLQPYAALDAGIHALADIAFSVR